MSKFRKALIVLNVLAIVLICAVLASAQPSAVVALETTWGHPKTNGGLVLVVRNWWLEYEIGYYDQTWQWRTFRYIDVFGTLAGAKSNDLANQSPMLHVASIPDWNPSSYMIFWSVKVRPFFHTGGPDYVLHLEVNAPAEDWYRVKGSASGYLYYDPQANQWQTYAHDRQISQTVTGPFPSG